MWGSYVMRARKLVIHATVIFFALLAGAPLQVRAAELTGFGPIKFGMTKEEAMAAINGDGRWETDDRLEYSYNWLEFDMKFTVRQHFRNGRAISAHVVRDSKLLFWYVCVSEALKIVGVIIEKYQITPFVRSGLKNESRLNDKVEEFETDIYYFGFDDGAFITFVNEMQEGTDHCSFIFLYYPAHQRPHPF
jgi:hypothetical protein